MFAGSDGGGVPLKTPPVRTACGVQKFFFVQDISHRQNIRRATSIARKFDASFETLAVSQGHRDRNRELRFIFRQRRRQEVGGGNSASITCQDRLIVGHGIVVIRSRCELNIIAVEVIDGFYPRESA